MNAVSHKVVTLIIVLIKGKYSKQLNIIIKITAYIDDCL